jgi:hypothetical protein
MERRKQARDFSVPVDDEVPVPLELAGIFLAQPIEIRRRPHVSAGDDGGSTRRRCALDHERDCGLLGRGERRAHSGEPGPEHSNVDVRLGH